MKKLLLAIAAVLLLAGCAHTRWTTISTGPDKEKIIQEYFPELYAQAQKGEVELHELRAQAQKDGTTKNIDTTTINIFDKICFICNYFTCIIAFKILISSISSGVASPTISGAR